MPSVLRHRAIALPILLGSLALPALAQAEAPTRDFGYDVAGAPATVSGVLGVSPDGGEVLFTSAADSSVPFNVRLFSRNLRTNTTTMLMPSPSYAHGASANLGRVLFDTAQPLDPADHNTAGDLYVLDRSTGTSTLVSRMPNGAPSGDAGPLSNGIISGDGSTVFFDATTSNGQLEVLRFDLATKTSTVLGPGSLRVHERIGTTAGAVVTTNGIYAGGRTLPVPPNPDTYHDLRQFRVSNNGRFVAEQNTDTQMAVTDTATGARSVIPVPASLVSSGYHLLGVADTGATVTVGTTVVVTSSVALGVTTTEGAIDHVSVASGAVSQVGSLLPVGTADSPSAILTPDESFVAFGKLSSLTTAPVPGTPSYPASSAFDYLTTYPGCSAGLFVPAIKPSLALTAAAVGANPKTPLYAKGLLVSDATGASTSFSVPAGGRVDLSGGYGGFTIVARVVFGDGSTASASKHIATYTPLRNDQNPFTGARGKCQVANAL